MCEFINVRKAATVCLQTHTHVIHYSSTSIIQNKQKQNPHFYLKKKKRFYIQKIISSRGLVFFIQENKKGI